MPGQENVFRKQKTVYSQTQREPDTFVFGGQNLNEGNFVAVGGVVRSMRLSEQKSGVSINAFGDHFEDKLTPKQRASAIKKSGSELNKKAQNKKLVMGAEAEYGRQLKNFTRAVKKTKGLTVPEELTTDFENACCLFKINNPQAGAEIWKDYCGTGEQRYKALDRIVEDFVNLDFTFDLSNDDKIAAESLKFIQIRKRSDAFIALIFNNIGYWNAVDDEAKAVVMKKLSQADQLWQFYLKKEEVITNEYYSTHMDSEIAYINSNSTDPDKVVTFMELTKKLQDAELAYENLKHMEDPDKEQLIQEVMRKKAIFQDSLGQEAVPLHREAKSKADTGSWLDMFGLPLKIASFFMRDKRVADHGKSQYKKMKAEFDDKFPGYLYMIGTGKERGFYRGEKGNKEAPPVKLDALFTDPIKLEIIEGLDMAREFREGATTEDEKESLKLYLDFVEAADRYVKIGGIVNADTTEMEMAFLDRMKEVEEQFGDKFDYESDATMVSKARARNVKDIMDYIRQNLYGNLKNVTKEAKYTSAVENSVVVIQDTTITENMDESNIKDIPLFTHYPNINDVKQSTIGDCYLVGAMTSFVKTSPQGVLDMFQDLGDGNVLVRLFDAYTIHGEERLDTYTKWAEAARAGNGSMRPVFVKVRKHYETGDGNANDCVWPQLIEKAYAAAGFNMKGVATVDKKGYLHDMEKELTNGVGYIALSHLTGKIQKRHNVYKMYDKTSSRIKRDAATVFVSADFQHRMGAGIPTFLRDMMKNYVGETEALNLDNGLLIEYLDMAAQKISADYGIKLSQLKQELVKKNVKSEVYAPLIQGLVDKLGLKLVDNWNKGGDADGEVVFDTAFISHHYSEKMLENLRHIAEGEDVTFDTEKALDTDVFSGRNIGMFLDKVVAASKEIKAETLEGDLKNVSTLIDSSIAFAGNDELKQQTINDHKAAKDAFWNDEEKKNRASRIAQRMQFEDHTNIKENMLDFMVNLKKAIEQGGSLEISINHFVSAVGMTLHNHQWYVLIKDPFNIYNMSYEKGKKGGVTKHEEGFLDVLNIPGYQIKRHLDPGKDISNNLMGGFRGLSWWSLTDLSKKINDFTPVVPEDVRHET